MVLRDKKYSRKERSVKLVSCYCYTLNNLTVYATNFLTFAYYM